VSFAVTRVLMKIFRTRSRDVTDQCQIMFGMLPVEHHMFLRKVRFLLRFKNYDNLICSLFLDNAFSEIKLICKKYSENVNNIYYYLYKNRTRGTQKERKKIRKKHIKV